MYARTLRKATHTRRLTIRNSVRRTGWQVVDEKDNIVIKCTDYDDWHRVERAREMFAAEATLLTEQGWVEG